jgi:hypothetical protein
MLRQIRSVATQIQRIRTQQSPDLPRYDVLRAFDPAVLAILDEKRETMVFNSIHRLCVSTSILLLAGLCSGGGKACAQVLFNEEFEDEMLAMGSDGNLDTIANGIISFDDTSDTTRGRFVVVQTFADPVMTFSFDAVAPATAAGADNELVFRAGILTGNNTLSSSEFILEAILYRTTGGGTAGGPRAPFVNNGMESMFLVANNKVTPLTFASPIDGTDVILNGFEYIPYIHNRETDVWAALKPAGAFTDRNGADPGPGEITRFGIGSSSNGHLGTSAIDNVRVVSGVSFSGIVGPPPDLGDTDGDGIVELEDFEPIRANFRKEVSLRAQGDLVRNNVVDFDDFHEWKTAFLGGGGSLEGVDLGFLGNVPEPTTGILLLPAGAVLCCRRWRES